VKGDLPGAGSQKPEAKRKFFKKKRKKNPKAIVRE
jgi:hypothetical protein